MGCTESASSEGIIKNPGSLCQSIMGCATGPMPPVDIMVCAYKRGWVVGCFYNMYSGYFFGGICREMLVWRVAGCCELFSRVLSFSSGLTGLGRNSVAQIIMGYVKEGKTCSKCEDCRLWLRVADILWDASLDGDYYGMPV